MGAETKIEWTKHTVNFWWGCSKVGPGCDHCYAETLSRRFDGAGPDGQSAIWGPGAPRRKIKSAAALVRKLDREAAFCGKRPWVFAQSMSDLFDADVPLDWFAEAWAAIKEATDLRWQIVTKRVSVIEKRMVAIGDTEWPRHAGLLISVVNQDEADRDVPRLLALKAKLNIPWVGLSMEPLLGPVDLRRVNLGKQRTNGSGLKRIEWDSLTGWERQFPEDTEPGCDPAKARMRGIGASGIGARMDWVIVGGESGPGARPMHPGWARSLRDQCAAAGVPFFFKQWGEFVPCVTDDLGDGLVVVSDGADSPRFDSDRKAPLIHIGSQEFWRIGKKAAGRLLDGVEHNAFPEGRT